MRYQVPGVPAQFSASAFTPNITRGAASGAQQYKGAVTGQPGTAGIPTGPALVFQDPHFSAMAKTSDAPDVFYPNQYYQRGLTNSAPVAIYSDNVMPIPAVDPRGRPAVLSNPPPLLRRQVQAVPILPRWT